MSNFSFRLAVLLASGALTMICAGPAGSLGLSVNQNCGKKPPCIKFIEQRGDPIGPPGLPPEMAFSVADLHKQGVNSADDLRIQFTRDTLRGRLEGVSLAMYFEGELVAWVPVEPASLVMLNATIGPAVIGLDRIASRTIARYFRPGGQLAVISGYVADKGRR